MKIDDDNDADGDDDDDEEEDDGDDGDDENLVSCVIVKQAPSHPTSPPAGKGPTDLCHWIVISPS